MIRIERWYQPDMTLGRLRIGAFTCLTLELPDRGNAQNVSCIPPGKYQGYYRSSPSNGPVVELLNVPGRSYIQIHRGSFLSNTRGCILVGMGLGFIDEDDIPDLRESQRALEKILSLIPKEGTFEVEIV